MIQTFNKLNIDVNKPINDIITAVEDDTKTRFLDVTLFQNGINLNLTGYKVRIYMIKPDGKEIFNDGVIRDTQKGRVEFELTNQALAVAGVLETQIKVFDNQETQILSTQIFKIFVTKNLMSSSSIESSNEYGSLVVLFQNVYEALTVMQEINNKIGVVGSKGQELSTDTLFKELEYLIDFSQKNSVGSLGNKVDNILNRVTKLQSVTNFQWTELPNLKLNVKSISNIFQMGNKWNTLLEVNNAKGGNLIMSELRYSNSVIGTTGYIYIKIEIDDLPILNLKIANISNPQGDTTIIGLYNDSVVTNYKYNYHRTPMSYSNGKMNFVNMFKSVFLQMEGTKAEFELIYGTPLTFSQQEQTIADIKKYKIETSYWDNTTPVYAITNFLKNPIPFKKKLKISINPNPTNNNGGIYLQSVYNLNN